MLEIDHVNKRFDKKEALHQVSLQLDVGVYGLLGPNGAGKSTLMNIITGNLMQDEGQILWNGVQAKNLGASYRALLGFAPQQQGLYSTFTGRQFIGYMAALKGISKKEASKETDKVLSYVNLTEVADKKVGTYSGGMKQRLLVAQAILGDPQIIVLDEPTAGLDPKERVRIREKINAIAKDRIVLISTHVVSDIQSIAKEIILIKKGEIVAKASVEELCHTYGDVSDLEEVYLKVFGEDGE